MDYKLLCEQLKELAKESSDPMPLMANASAMLYNAMPLVRSEGRRAFDWTLPGQRGVRAHPKGQRRMRHSLGGRRHAIGA